MLSFLVNSDLNTRLVPPVCAFDTAQGTRFLAGCHCIARRHVESWISEEKVSRSQQQRHRLCWHDRVILWRRKVRDTERVPKHNVRVIDAFITGFLDPLW